MKEIVTFLRNVHVEFGKVIWPRRSELIDSTFVVTLLVIFYATYLGIIDFVLARLARLVY